ncbi:hypothetical protein [Mycoplasmopsis primatum]|uniref:hypothetical protein n=1 Tax=Mycoplasmopsis primatum TaxID=55604 RepID=UPI0004965BC6|nr:hypothetical protein [Mycoplasmopsis primatum]
MNIKDNFLNLFVKYILFLINIQSITILKTNHISNIKIRIKILLNRSFLLHSLGINYCKNLYKKYRKNVNKFINDVLKGRINEDIIINDIPKHKQSLFLKKLNSIHLLNNHPAFKNNKYNFIDTFEYFKIKPKTDDQTTYDRSQIVIVSKSDENNKRLIIYGLSSQWYTTKTINQCETFYNPDRSYVNSAFLPISLKYKNISDEDLKHGYLKIDKTFLNKRNLNKENVFA